MACVCVCAVNLSATKLLHRQPHSSYMYLYPHHRHSRKFMFLPDLILMTAQHFTIVRSVFAAVAATVVHSVVHSAKWGNFCRPTLSSFARTAKQILKVVAIFAETIHSYFISIPFICLFRFHSSRSPLRYFFFLFSFYFFVKKLMCRI